MKNILGLLTLSVIFFLLLTGVSYAISLPSNLEQEQGGVSKPAGTWLTNSNVTFSMNKPSYVPGPFGIKLSTGIRVWIYRTDASWLRLLESPPNLLSTASVSYSFPDGSYRWQAASYYVYGESAKVEFPEPWGNGSNMDFGVDTVPPSNGGTATESHGIASGSWTNIIAPSFQLHGTDATSQVLGYYWYFDQSDIGEPNIFSVNDTINPPAMSADGTYYLRVKTQDNAGWLSPKETLFTYKYDGIPPIAGAGSPVVQVTTDSISVNCPEATDSGGSGIKSPNGYTTTISGGLTINKKTDVSSPILYEAGLTPNTAYAVQIKAIDNAGNETVIFDRTIYTAAVAPNIGADKTTGIWYNNPNILFNNNAGFGQGAVGYYRWLLDNSSSTPSSLSNNWNAGQLPLQIKEGDNYLHVESYNADGVPSGSATYGPFKYDGTPPTISNMTGLADNSYVKGAVTLSLSAADSGGSGIKVVSFFDVFNGATRELQSGLSSVLNLNTTKLNNGRHEIKMLSEDNAGNRSWISKFFNADNYKPKIAVPKKITVKRGKKFNLVLKVTDPYTGGGLWVDIIIKKGKKVVKKVKKQVKPGVPDKTKINTRMTWPSKLDIQVKAKDKAGNVDYTNTKLFVK